MKLKEQCVVFGLASIYEKETSAVGGFSKSPIIMVANTALLKVDFGSRSHSRVPDFYSTFVKKSTSKLTLLDFKSCKSDLDSTPPRRSTPSPKPHLCDCGLSNEFY